MPTFGILIDAILLVLGAVWCKFIFARFRSDLAEVRSSETERADRIVIIVYWLITLAVIAWIISFVVGLLG